MPGPLAAKIRAKYPGVYDDLDDATLEAKVLEKYPQYRDLTEDTPEPPAAPQAPKGSAAGAHARVGRFVQRNLPTIAAGAGAFATGGAGLIPAAAVAGLSGSAGAIAQQLLERLQGTRAGGPDLPSAAKEGATQAALEVGGGLAGKALQRGAKAAYKLALRPTKRVTQEFPTVVEDAIEAGIPVTTGGARKADTLVGASAREADALIAAAEALGKGPVNPKVIRARLRSDVTPIALDRQKLGKSGGLSEVAERMKAVTRENPKGLQLSEAQRLKRRAQADADSVFRAIDRGNPPSSDTGALLDAATARGLKEGIEQQVPGVGPVNARTRRLVGVSQSVEDATQRNGGMLANLLSLMTGGGLMASGRPGTALATGLGMRALSSPATLSHGAIAANRVAPYQSQLSRALLMALSDDAAQ